MFSIVPPKTNKTQYKTNTKQTQNEQKINKQKNKQTKPIKHIVPPNSALQKKKNNTIQKK
jgi:hypothetical protein